MGSGSTINCFIVLLLLTEGFTENFHGEKETGASGHVGDHTAVLAAVFRPHFLDLEVLPPGQPLNTTPQLSGRRTKGKETASVSKSRRF